MKTVLSISLLALSGLCAMSQDVSVAEIRESAKMIPVVSYTPLGFESAVGKAFKFDGTTDCFFIKDAGKKAQTVYWLNDFAEKGQFGLSKLEKPLPLSATQTEILATADSAFIFLPAPDYPFVEFMPQHIRYVAWLEGGRTRYASTDRTFDSLYDFIVSEYGSAGNFASRYLERLGDAFLSSRSGLYGFDSERRAIDFLRDDYRFNAVCGAKAEKIVPLYIALLKKAVVVTPEQEKRLNGLLTDSYKADDKTVSDFLAGRPFEVFRPACLRTVFSPDECSLIETAVREDNARLAGAYRLLWKTVGNTDPATGAYLSDRDILKKSPAGCLSNER